MNKVKEIEVVKIFNRTIETEKIENTPYSYYKDTIVTTCNGKSTTVIRKGATTDENINAATGLEPIKTTVPVPKMYRECANIEVIKKSDLEKIQSGEVHVTDIMYRTKNNYDPIKEDEMLVLWNSGSHKLCDLNQNYIPLPIHIGYMDGGLSNDKYKLRKIIGLVKENEHVLDRKNVRITNIPYYNCYEGRDKSIEFKYLADFDEYQMLMELHSKNYYSMHRYIIDKLIGAEQFKKEDDN